MIAPPTLVPVAQAGIMMDASTQTVLDSQTVTITVCVSMLWTRRSASKCHLHTGIYTLIDYLSTTLTQSKFFLINLSKDFKHFVE